MKFLVILVSLSLVGVTYAGVGVTTQEIEQAALALWQRYCNGASEGGQDQSSGAFIYCKRSRDTYEESLQHNVEIPRGPEAREQIVFVQPPSYHYKHDVVVSGGGGSAPKTIIYVKPAKNTHVVNVNDQTQPNAAPQKPTLYFLRGNHGASESQAGSQPQRPQPTQPSSGYNYNPPSQPLQEPSSGYNYNPPQRGLRY